MLPRLIVGVVLLAASACAPRMAQTHYTRWANQDKARAQETVASAPKAQVPRPTATLAPAPEAPRLIMPKPKEEPEPPEGEEPKKDEEKEGDDFVY